MDRTFRNPSVAVTAALFLMSLALLPSQTAAQASSPEWSASISSPFDTRPDPPIAKPDQPLPTDFRKIPEEGVYIPMDGTQRLKWFAAQTVGPESFLAGMFTAGIGTARGKPAEYGGHWDGFSKRYAMRFSGLAVSNLVEAGLSSAWGEDTRYMRHGSDPFGKRLSHVFLMTVTARHRNGHLAPAYARYVAIAGSNFLSNTWRANSESRAGDALIRTGYGFMGRLVANSWDEFWPSVRPHLLPRSR